MTTDPTHNDETENGGPDNIPDLVWPAREIPRFDWSKDKLTPEQENALAAVEALPWSHPLRCQVERLIASGLWPPPPGD